MLFRFASRRIGEFCCWIFLPALFTLPAAAQLSGIKTIDPLGSGGSNYTSFTAAINALNGSGVTGFGVTFNVAAGAVFHENPPPIIATGQAIRPIVFQRSGAGANPVVKPVARGMRYGTQFGNGDAIFQINGGDYISFDGIDAVDDTVNFINHGRFEYGFLIRKASSMDGCKNVEIKNCTVILAKSNRYATGIMVSNMVPTYTAITSTDTTAVGVTVTDESGRHENIRIFGNTIINALVGIGARGYNHQAPPYNLYDHFVEIGEDGGNTITGFGYGSSTAPHGVYAVYQDSMRVSKNVIQGGQGATINCYGILATGSAGAYMWIYDNTVTITSSASTSSLIGISINFSGTGSRADLVANKVLNCTYPTATSGAFYGIYNQGAIEKLMLDSNRIAGNVHAGTSNMYLMYAGGSAALSKVEAVRNTITGNSKTGSGGAMYCIYAGADSVRVFRNRLIDNSICDTSTISQSLYGYYNIGNPRCETVDSNCIDGMRGKGSLYGIFSQTISRAYKYFRGDTIVGFSLGGGYGINQTSDTVCIITDCIIGESDSLFGMTAITVNNSRYCRISRNTIRGIWVDSTGAGGIAVTSDNAIVTNNMISDLGARSHRLLYAAATTGISVGPLTASTASSLVAYNTVFLSSAVPLSKVSHVGLYAYTTARTILKNNIVVITALPGTVSGTSTAYVRSNATLTSYDSSSNNNLFYAGTPSSTCRIYSDGTNTDLTLAAYKTRVFPRDSSSISEMAPFVNASGAPFDLHLDPGMPTRCESGGRAVAGVTDDYDGEARHGATGYSGTGTAPDIGADEGNFTRDDILPPDISYLPLTPGVPAASRIFGHVYITDPSGVNSATGTRPRVYYKKSTHSNALGLNNSSTDGWKWVEANSTASPFEFTLNYSLLYGGTGVALGDVIQYFVVAQDSAIPAHVGINAGTFSSQPTSVDLTGFAFPIGGSPRSFIVADTISGSVAIPGTYSSLTGADGFFADMNGKKLAGNLTVFIADSVYEDGAVALNAFGQHPPASQWSLTIASDTARMRLLYGSSNTQALIRLNGADGVTFDGRYGGAGQFLRVVNTGASYPVLSLMNDASRNTIRNCIIEGSSTAVAGGLLHFGAGTSTGNDSNLVQDNLFRRVAGVDSAYATAIYSGASSSAKNSFNRVLHNRFQDFSAHGVFLGPAGNGDQWQVSDNAFYRSMPGDAWTNILAISFEGGGMGHRISGNSIGGSDTLRGGAAFASTGGIGGMRLIVGNLPGGAACSVQDNVIANIRSSGLAGTAMIAVAAGKADIGTEIGNVIGGGGSAGDSIHVAFDADLIYVGGGDTVRVENNLVSHARYDRNAANRLIGIAVYDSGTVTVAGNIVRELTSNTTGLSVGAASAPLAGLRLSGAPRARIEGNTVSALHNPDLDAAARGVYGIVVAGCGRETRIERNRVWNLVVDNQYSGSQGPWVVGVQCLGGGARYANNQVTLGSNVTYDPRIRGFESASDSLNEFYFNSVFIGGASTAAAENASYAFHRASNGPLRLRNNAFVNARMGSGWVDRHFAIGSGGTINWAGTAFIPSVTSNYNFFATRDSANMGDWNTMPSSFFVWKNAVTNNDVFSHYIPVSAATSPVGINPTDLFPNTASGNLAVDTTREAAWFLHGKGVTGAECDTVRADYDGILSRSNVAGLATDIGSDAFSMTLAAPLLLQTGVLASGNSTEYWMAGRKLARISWDAQGTAPDSVHARFYSGDAPPNVAHGRHADAYWNIVAFGGVGYSYSISLFYTPAVLGGILAHADARLAKKDASAAWVHYPSSVLDTAAANVTQGGFASFSDFTLSDDASPLPVELVTFSARLLHGSVRLVWSTASELNAFRYYVERRSMTGWEELGYVNARGSVDTRSDYAFIDALLPPAREFVYRLRMTDRDGSVEYSNEVSVASGFVGFTLAPNHPNPFARKTTITMMLPAEEFVTLLVYDAAGREVESLNSGTLSAGTHSFVFTARNLPDGVYRIVAVAGGETRTGMMLLLR